MQARLSQILVDNVLPLDPMEIIFNMIWRTIFSTRKTLFFLEGLITPGAAPSHKAWLYGDILVETMGILIKLFDEV